MANLQLQPPAGGSDLEWSEKHYLTEWIFTFLTDHKDHQEKYLFNA